MPIDCQRRFHSIPWNRLLPVLVGASALLVYAVTAAPSIVELYDDSLEFQLVGPTFGIAHPTGYPLYTLLGGLWSRALFPLGNWAWRMNLFSAVTGAAAVSFVFVLARRLCDGSDGAGLAAAIVFGLSPVWWQQTTVAEVYALHNLFVAAILYVAVIAGKAQGRDAQMRREESVPNARRHRRVLLLCALIGLALTHHRTAVLLLPGIALYLLWRLPGIWRPRRAWIGWTLALLLPLLLYTYIPLRAAMGAGDLQGDYVNTWRGFWDHVLARGYTGFFADNPLASERSFGDWFVLLRAQVGWIGLFLAVLGLAGGLWQRTRRAEWTLVLVTLGANLIFAVNYRVADVAVFTLPVVLCVAVAAGGGVAVVGQVAGGRWQVAARKPRVPSQRAFRLLSTAAILLLLFLPFGRGPAVNRAGDWTVHDYAVDMAKVDFPPQSRVVGLRGQTTALTYMQRAEGLGQNAIPVAIDDPEQRRRFVIDAVASGLPVYLTQEVEGIGNRFSFGGFGPLVRVWPRGEADAGVPSIPHELLLGEEPLRLLGYDRTILDQAGGPALRVVFYWQPTQPLQRTLKLSLRLQTADGEPIHRSDGTVVVEDRFPLRQVALTPDWLPGEVVRDVHTLPLPGVTPNRAQLLVIVYDAETVVEIGRFTIDLPPLPK